MNRLKINESPEATKQLWSLANGPKPHVKEYTVCMVNGVKFHTRDLDNRRITQNSGVCSEGDHEGEMHDFYGIRLILTLVLIMYIDACVWNDIWYDYVVLILFITLQNFV